MSTIRIAPPRIANKWSPERRLHREVKQAYAESDLHEQRVTDLNNLCHSICMTRTSGGRVGVEYPALRKRISAFYSKWSVISGDEWTWIRHHIMYNRTNCLLIHAVNPHPDRWMPGRPA